MSLEDLKTYSNTKNRFMRHCGITIQDVTAERVVANLVIGPDSLNPNAHLHGGAIFTLADATAGTLARADGRQHVTECCDIHFLRGATEGTVTAVATPILRGKRSTVIRVAVTREDGTLMAEATAHFVCVAEHY